MKKAVKIFVCLTCLTICRLGYSQTTYYVVNESTEYGSGGNLFNTTTIHTYSLSGPGVEISYDAKIGSGSAIYYSLNVLYSSDNQTWTTAQEYKNLKTNWSTSSCEIPESAKYVRFQLPAGQTLTSNKRSIRNVKISRATTLSSGTTSLDFGIVKQNESKNLTINVDFNNSYSDAVLTGTCTNSAFTVKQENMSETGSKAITITFTPKAIGNQSGTVTLSMGTQGKNNNVTYQFTVSGTGVSGDMYPGNVSGYRPDSYASVTLYRTLPAGLSTIALPFDTTIDALAGSGNGKAYTLSNVGYDQNQGYLFYFAEVAELEAGKPYLINLTNQVVNPVWDNVTVGALTPVTITRGGWNFTANFTPAKNMDGSYGVVNSQSKIMKGGPSSFINAFGAYFQLNQAVSSSSKTSSSEDYPISNSQQRMTIILQ